MSATSQMKGARLEYVLREIKGKITRPVTSYDAKQKKLVHKEVETDGGYMLYLPTGLSYRLTKEQVIKRGLNQQPSIMNMDRVQDANTPAGRFKFAINDKARMDAWAELENEVIRTCTRKTGFAIQEGKVNGSGTANAA